MMPDGNIEGLNVDEEVEVEEPEAPLSAPLSVVGNNPQETPKRSRDDSVFCQEKGEWRQEEVGDNKRGSKRGLDQKYLFTCWSHNPPWGHTSEASSSKESRHDRNGAKCSAGGMEKWKVDQGGPSWGSYSQSSSQTWYGKQSRQERWWPQEEGQDWQCSCPTKW